MTQTVLEQMKRAVVARCKDRITSGEARTSVPTFRRMHDKHI